MEYPQRLGFEPGLKCTPNSESNMQPLGQIVGRKRPAKRSDMNLDWLVANMNSYKQMAL